MDQPKLHAPRFYNTSCVDNKRDEIEEKYDRCYVTLQNLISGLSDKEAHDALNNTVAKDKAHEETICLGLLAVILTEPSNCAKSYRDLTLVARDGLLCVHTHLSQLILERWVKLTDVVKSQLLWLVREMIKTGVGGVEPLCWNLMRHMAGGDVTPKNIFLIETVLDILIENRSWLEKFPLIIATSVYTFLRLIEDHMAPSLANLQKKEIGFTVSLLRERFADCLIIGRDLIRLLQNVARIPEFESLWRDLLQNPKSFCPSFNGVLSLLQTRTSRRFLQSRLTPDMEQKLVFLTSNVRFGNHKRYQDWFQRQKMSQGKSGRENASKELLEDETNFGNTGNDLDSLVQEGKPKKLSILLLKDPEDFIGNEAKWSMKRSAFNGSVDLDYNHGRDDQQSFSPPLHGPSGTSGGLEHLPAPPKVDELKEMDMKLLKNTIWEYIARNEKNVPENGRRKPVLFSNV